MMKRARAILEYDGSVYRGWQRQPDAVTVQGTCEAALAKIVGGPIDVVAAGRTDSGVHARGQVVHFDAPGRLGPAELARAWNACLPTDVRVRRLVAAADGFHARYDATGRTYRYFVSTGENAESPFVQRWAWPLPKTPEWAVVEDATRRFVGEHDFRRFAKNTRSARVRAGSAPGRCVVRRAEWFDTDEGRALEIVADRFLRHMVRALVGAAIGAGRGRVAPDEIDAALAGGARTKAAYAPPRGLFLWRVDYSSAKDDADG